MCTLKYMSKVFLAFSSEISIWNKLGRKEEIIHFEKQKLELE